MAGVKGRRWNWGDGGICPILELEHEYEDPLSFFPQRTRFRPLCSAAGFAYAQELEWLCDGHTLGLDSEAGWDTLNHELREYYWSKPT